ncbi:Zinc finger DNA binding protein [Operophtera brumata]|uniref:Zinc finger DNA binding protein n=1 Tax=Operophtera brumata TaxID=104452 RepID=A0A0L7K2T7_OPEBR|nr:Zinc finger DNA binding protein [Operophtera brumata]
MFNCHACNTGASDGVTCSSCGGVYCFLCANINEKNYRKLGAARQATLLCASCKSSQPRALSSDASPANSSQQAQPCATLDLVLQELREMREGIRGIDARLEQLPILMQEVRDITIRTVDVEKRVSALEDKCSGADNYPQLQEKLSQLTSVIAAKEQRERVNNIEIRGVPLKKAENLFQLVAKIGDAIGHPVLPSQINFVTRSRSTADIKPVIVGFLCRYTKENFVASARTRKNLTAEDLGFSGVLTRVYVNDHLTRENKQLLTKTKKVALDHNHKYTWVQNCKILVRKNYTSPIIHILSEVDLAKIK